MSEQRTERAAMPHCDARILHAPGECGHCDRYPDWQELRRMWGIAFTGHRPQRAAYGTGTELPCPADHNRPPGSHSDHRQWGGNVAATPGQVRFPIPVAIRDAATPRRTWRQRILGRRTTRS